MGSYFADKWDNFTGAMSFIVEHPRLFLLLLVIFGPIIWLRWGMMSRSTAKGHVLYRVKAD